MPHAVYMPWPEAFYLRMNILALMR